VLLAASPSLAATTISGTTTTPVATATANNGNPDDVVISGSITVTGTTPAATLNSSNKLDINGGSANIKDVDNSTGVLIQGGNTGEFTNGGSVIVNESYAPTDVNSDGVADGPWAKGTGRYGVRIAGPGAFVGTITTNSGSSISVQGNNSFGLSIETPLQGDVIHGGTITTVGDNSIGLNETGGVSGQVKLTGGVSATGQGAVGASFSGDIAGRLSLYTSLSATGYHQTTRSSDPAVNAGLYTSGPNNDLYISGPALQVQANVGGGVLIAAPPPGTLSSDAATDADGDGVIDNVEGTGAISTFGPGPAAVIGAAGKSITLGEVVPGNAISGYGLVIEGTINGTGVFDKFTGQALQIGAPGGTVTINGGVNIPGSVTASSWLASATTLHVMSGVTFPELRVGGNVSAATTSTQADTATAISIDSGANVQALTVTGQITGAITGDLGSAVAVVDNAGQISTVLNEGVISTGISPTALGDVTHGTTTALDLSHNTTGVSLTQQTNPSPPPTTSTDSSGTVTRIAGTAVTPAIKGDVLLGSGSDAVNLLAGSINGKLDFAGGANNTFLIDNGSTYAGQMTASGVLGVNVANGSLEDDSATTISTSQLHLGSKALLTVSADPINNTSTFFNASGPVAIDSGAQIGLHLVSLLPTTAQLSYTIISSPSLTIAETDGQLAGETPYLYVTGFHADTNAGTVSVDIRRRTAEEAGLSKAQTAAFDPIYGALSLDADIQRAFLAQTTQEGLSGMINQMLPDHAGGVFRALDMATEQQGVAAAEPPVGQDQEGPTRAWTQEIVLDERKDPGEASGYKVLGFSAVGGLESVSARGDALGVKLGFVTSNINNPSIPSDNLLGLSQISAGVYYRGEWGGLHTDAQLGAGYIWVNNRREFLYSDDVGVVHRTATSGWNGYSFYGRLGAKYLAQFGNFFLEPGVHADYFRLHEGGYVESGGGQGFDLAVAGRTSDLMSVTSSVTAGVNLGSTGFRWRPQVEAGYRAVVSGSESSTTANFLGTNDPFTLYSEALRESSLIGRVGLHIYANYLDLLLDAGAQYNKDVTDVDVHLTARTVF
jgi:hypothetical protein